MTPATLHTDRLTLRPLALDDAEAMHVIYADPGTTRFSSHAPHVHFAESVDRVAKAVASPDWRHWAIVEIEQGALIGNVLAHERRQGRVFEIGYSLVPARWGKGYANEAVSRLITHLFDDDHARRVFADTDPNNAASNRLLERLGFTCEGRLRGEWETHIGVSDSFIWGLLAEEWAS